MRRYALAGIVTLAFVMALMGAGVHTTAGAGTVVVKPSAMNGWYFWNDFNDTFTGSPGELVSGPATPPSGSGSVRLGPLTTASGATGHSVIATNAYAGTPLANITALSYSTYQAGPTLAIAVQFDVQYQAGPFVYGGRLVFEPYQNGAVVVGSGWQSWSPLSGVWWASKTNAAGTGGAQAVALPAGNCAQGTPCTWSQINAAFPAATIVGRFLLKAGSNWSGFDGNADNLTVGISGSNTTFDFEAETPCTTTCYVDAAAGNDAFGGNTLGAAKKTIQAAINQVSAGGQVRVLPGVYNEAAPGSAPTTIAGIYQFGLFFGSAKPGITLMGVTAGDIPVASAAATLATINTDATNNFGTSGIFVEAANTTIKGVKIGPNVSGDNKTIEVVGDNFTLRESTTAIPAGGGSIYINDFSPGGTVVQSYHVLNNIFPDGTSVDISSGAGNTGPLTGREILGNTFDLGGNGFNAISFNGTGGPPWFAVPVGGASIKSNSFANSTQYIRARGVYDNTQFDWKSFWNDNTYDKAAVALVTSVPFDVRSYSYVSAPYTFTNVRRIGGTIQEEVDHAVAGDTVKAKTGVYPEHVIVNKSITLTAGSAPIIDGGGSGDGITIAAPNVTESLFEVRNVTNGIVIASGADNASVSSNNIHNFTSAAIRGSSATGAAISSNTISGGHVGSCVGGFWGIQVQGVSGTIGSNTISGIGNGITTGCQEGRAIEADGTGAVQITNNNLSQYQKSGIIVRNTVNSIITGNTTAGEGPSGIIAMNGITITSSGTASITGNHTSGHLYSPVTDVSCGILLFGSGATVTGNDSTEDEVGVCAVGGTGAQIKTNAINKHHQQGILVDGVASVLVDGNTIDGQAGGTTATPGTDPDSDVRYYGIFAVDSTGTLSNNIIKNITHGPLNGLQSGVGIRLTARTGAGSSNMTISGNNISNVQKNAMVVTNTYGGASVNANVTGNTVAGNGPINYIAQNGIQVSSGATASVTNNDASGYDYTGPNAAAIGVLVLDAGAVTVANNNIHNGLEGMYVQNTNGTIVTGNTFTSIRDAGIVIWLGSSNGTYSGNTMMGTLAAGTADVYMADNSTNNTFTGNAFRNSDTGVFVDYTGGGAPAGNVFHLNCFSGNVTAGLATGGTQSGGIINAENNWWGRVDGPSPIGHGDAIDSPTTIDAVPYLTATTAGCPVPLDGDGDGLNDPSDNCPSVYNPDQANHQQEPVSLPKPFPPYDDATNPIGDNVGDACSNDIDHDGLSNAQEIALGTSPFVADTDGDRINDGTEVLCGSDPLNKLSVLTGTDTDHDGLPDACEALYGTNPSLVDSDGDGVLDGVEVRYWMTSPLSKNTDGDNCTDNREIASFNDDRKVNSTDLLLVAKLQGAVTPEYGDLDTNGDGKLNSTDLLFVAKNQGACTAN